MPDIYRNARIVVCGCGPVGSLAALAAAKRGLEVDVYDLRDGQYIQALSNSDFFFFIKNEMTSNSIEANTSVVNNIFLDLLELALFLKTMCTS